MPALDESTLKSTGVIPIKSQKPISIAGGLIYTTGEVERITSFEKGFPWAEAKINGNWVADPFRDDQGIVTKVKGK